MSSPDNNVQRKREDYINWQEYFMATALLSAKRSKDPRMQVGACIVNKDNKIVGVGYNGMLIGCSDDDFPWGKGTASPLESKYLYVCHAELNAIANKFSADITDCAIYVSLFPCNECAKLIIQSGIKKVIYLSDKHADKPETVASKRMFDAVGVNYWSADQSQRWSIEPCWNSRAIFDIFKRDDGQFRPSNMKVEIHFDDIA